MAVFKCKMCGASLEVNVGDRIVECEYCNSTQTVPNLDTDKKLKLYDRANHFRQHNDYDKSIAIYEQILGEDREDAEAYWSLVLCRYGIEYVDDPATGNKVPTCHRTIPESIFEDLDYKEAIAHADEESAKIYKKEAKQIDLIQKSILAISQKEKPYDIFICYKESDANNQRTKDSVIAQDIYDKLTDKGYKVFFSRITLEDKLGQEYEPYIYAALTSAKVMLVIGTKPEYFNAVWVKNEWARYLSFMAKDKNKYLIPCYKNMTPYEMPEEFAALQSQDLSKVGFEQDLLRGIDKILGKEKRVENTQQSSNQEGGMVNSLLMRTENFLKIGNFEKAQDYAQKILDIDAKNAQAYKYLLLAEMKEESLENLSRTMKDFSNAESYLEIKVLEDKSVLNEVNQVLKSVKTNILDKKNSSILNKAVNTIKTSCNMSELKNALVDINSLGNWKNAKQVYEEQLKFVYNNAIERTKEGYTFLGWSEGGSSAVVKNIDLHKWSKEHKKLVANWQANMYTITYDANTGSVSKTKDKVVYDSKVILPTPTKKGCFFDGWYNGTTKYTSGIWKTASNVTLRAKWMTFEEYSNPEYSNGKIVSFTYGKYPQTIKADGVTITTTRDSRGYYLGSDNAYYAKVTATPREDNYKYSSGDTITKGNTYYFKVEPIKWKVLYNRDGTYMVISDLILDSQCYHNSSEKRNGATDYQGNSTRSKVKANNYKYSDIRTFLNTTFLNTAFTSKEQTKIQITTVDNSVYSTGYRSNSYACEDTQDKIFLLSYREATNQNYGFSIRWDASDTSYAKGTDYAKGRGLKIQNNGNSNWWLRSPYDDDGDYARYVRYVGIIYYDYGSVNVGNYGVRPALNINL